VPASELHSIIKPWPFTGWALDVTGQVKPMSSKDQNYILVGIDYFTKWIEAIPLKEVTQDEDINFIQKYIIYRFGIPETITTDQGSVFIGQKMVKFAENTGFKLLTSTPYYTQANGQVEAANGLVLFASERVKLKESIAISNLMEGFPPICKQDPLDVQLYYIHDHFQATGETIQLEDIPKKMYGGALPVAKGRKSKKKALTEAEYLDDAFEEPPKKSKKDKVAEAIGSALSTIQEEVQDLEPVTILNKRT